MNGQRTVIIFEHHDYAEVKFLVARGDLRHLHETYLGADSSDPEHQKELNEIVCDEGHLGWASPRWLEDFPTTAVLEGAFVITCGMVS